MFCGKPLLLIDSVGISKCHNHKLDVYKGHNIFDFSLDIGDYKYTFYFDYENNVFVLKNGIKFIFRGTYSKYMITPENAEIFLKRILNLKSFL